MGKLSPCTQHIALSMLINRQNANAEKDKEKFKMEEDGDGPQNEEVSEEKDEYSVDEPGEKKCAMVMMMNLIV